MASLEDLTLYFIIACSLTSVFVVVILIWLTYLHVKLRRLKIDNRNMSDIADGVSLGRIYTTCELRRGTYKWEWNKNKKISNQLSRQTNMMAEFCYTNPTIVKGEELDRRGFSMYSGSTHFAEDFDTKNRDSQGGTYHEARSKF